MWYERDMHNMTSMAKTGKTSDFNEFPIIKTPRVLFLNILSGQSSQFLVCLTSLQYGEMF
jgi:hypothetical protein